MTRILYTIFALGLQIQFGFTGLLNFGHVAFMAIGASFIAWPRPIQEKMAFFWHHVFATGNSKVDNDNHLTIQVQMFREHGMGNFRDLLLQGVIW